MRRLTKKLSDDESKNKSENKKYFRVEDAKKHIKKA